MRKKMFELSVVLLCVLGFIACGKKTASKDVQNEITGWAKDVELYKEENIRYNSINKYISSKLTSPFKSNLYHRN